MPFRAVLYRMAANGVALLHLIWIALVAGGAAYVFLADHRFVLVHAGLIGIGLLFWIVIRVCPLTWLEEKLRRQDNPHFSYHNSFIAHHWNKLFKTHWTGKQINFLPILAYVILGIIDILIFLHR